MGSFAWFVVRENVGIGQTFIIGDVRGREEGKQSGRCWEDSAKF